MPWNHLNQYHGHGMVLCTAPSSSAEAQTEGDSFIIAFHDPQSAAEFCIAVQVCSLVQPALQSYCTHQAVQHTLSLCAKKLGSRSQGGWQC